MQAKLEIERVMNVNFYGTVYMTKEFLPHLLQGPAAHLTNISSMGGFLPVPGQSIYGATKAAVKLFTEGLHTELSNTSVKVTVVFPGVIDTNIAANSGVGIKVGSGNRQQVIRLLAPSKAAQLIIAGIEQDRYRIMLGPDSALMDLLYRVSASYASRFIARQMQSLLPD